MSENVVAVRSIEIVTAEITMIRDNARKVFLESVIQIGTRLEEAKQMVPSGEDVALPEELEILHRSATGRVQTLIVRGSAEEVTARLSVLQPLLLEALPQPASRPAAAAPSVAVRRKLRREIFSLIACFSFCFSFFSIVYSVGAAKPKDRLCYSINKVYTLEQREGQGSF